MELYNIKEDSYIKIIDDNVLVPVESLEVKKDEIIFFSHMDGMYSYCLDINDNIVHIGRFTNVKYSNLEDFKNQIKK